jgi:PAS domain S-box-containing protein
MRTDNSGRIDQALPGIPPNAEVNSAAEPRRSAGTSTPGWIRILLVEDNADDADLIERTIKRAGLRPYTVVVDTAEAARAYLDRQEWDLVISDYTLPGSSAEEVLSVLRETGLDIPFILVCGTVGDDVAVSMMRGGANDYVLKERLARLPEAILRELAAARVRAARTDGEALFKSAFEDAPVGMAVLTSEGRYLRVNQRIVDMLGYSATELLSLHYSDVVHPDDLWTRATLGRRLSETAAAAPSRLPTVLRNIRKDGQVIWVSLHLAAVRSGTGAVQNFVVHLTDVTEQLEAERGLERTRAQLDQAQEIGAIGTWIQWIKPGEERTVWSKAEFRIVGMDPATTEVSVDLYLSLIHPEDRVRVTERLRAAISGEPYEVSHRIIRPDGQTRWVFTRASLVRDSAGVPDQLLGVTQDVTDQHLASEASVRNQELLATVLDNSAVIVFAVDRSGALTLAAGSLLEAVGLNRDAAMAVNVFDALADMPTLLGQLRRAMEGESFVGEVEVPSFGRWLSVRCDPVRDGEGNLTGVTGIANDITDRVIAARDRADIDLRSRLAAIMNHEIRTPLNSVLGFAELLNMTKAGTLNPVQARYVSNILTAGRHLLALINDSLDIAKLAAGEMRLASRSLALADVLAEVADQVRPMVDSHQLRLEVGCAPGIVVLADGRYLHQILFNLLSNAIKHSAPGGLIRLGGEIVDGVVAITVEDFGRGIATADLERIFLEFVTLETGVEGSGLGLPLSRRLAQLMGGDIAVISTLDAGSTFTLLLPIAAPSPVAA